MSRITWYFDFISPFAYLQAVEIDKLGIEVVPRPVLLAGLLKHWGHKGPAEIPTKRLFTYRHCLWLARKHGISMRFPESHPFNPLFGLRLALAAGSSWAAIMHIFRFVWEEGHSFVDLDRCRELAGGLGVDMERTQDATIKERLMENGSRAIQSGVFGVPTLLVDGQLFWGFDATDMALDYLSGKLPLDQDEDLRLQRLPVSAHR
ncbi:MAG: 2-hydroxychromene-2-carboxylate isomerase [Acidobacteria bacterium]|nr:2-hydroxychromene-2-carboxylate isomerase [Acidobacteriota bacterium]